MYLLKSGLSLYELVAKILELKSQDSDGSLFVKLLGNIILVTAVYSLIPPVICLVSLLPTLGNNSFLLILEEFPIMRISNIKIKPGKTLANRQVTIWICKNI